VKSRRWRIERYGRDRDAASTSTVRTDVNQGAAKLDDVAATRLREQVKRSGQPPVVDIALLVTSGTDDREVRQRYVAGAKSRWLHESMVGARATRARGSGCAPNVSRVGQLSSSTICVRDEPSAVGASGGVVGVPWATRGSAPVHRDDGAGDDQTCTLAPDRDLDAPSSAAGAGTSLDLHVQVSCSRDCPVQELRRTSLDVHRVPGQSGEPKRMMLPSGSIITPSR
jgi:hypothetical protein